MPGKNVVFKIPSANGEDFPARTSAALCNGWRGSGALTGSPRAEGWQDRSPVRAGCVSSRKRRPQRPAGQQTGEVSSAAMVDRGAGSSEHLERLHEIFRVLHGELRGAPERLRGSSAVGRWEGSGAGRPRARVS